MSKDNGVITFLLGAAVGVGVGLYLNSKKGKTLTKEVSKKLGDVEDTIEKDIGEAYQNLKDKVSLVVKNINEETSES